MKMQDVVLKLKNGDPDMSGVVCAVMDAWAECVEEICERLDGLQPGANKTEQCATVRALAVEWGFEIHPTAGVCVDKSKVSE